MKSLEEVQEVAEFKSLSDDLHKLNALRSYTGRTRPKDLSLGEFMKGRHGIAYNEKTGVADEFFHKLGINPIEDTIDNFLSMPEIDSRRWVIPEIFREAMIAGKSNPLWKDIIAGETPVNNLSVIMPYIDAPKGIPEEIGEGVSIPFGDVDYKDKTVRLNKIAVGINMSDEVVKFSTINNLAIYLRQQRNFLDDKINAKGIEVAMSGDQENGSQAVAAIGVENVSDGITYSDLLDVWLTMGDLGQSPDVMIAGKKTMKKILLLDEFRKKDVGEPEKVLRVNTPIPRVQNIYNYGLIPPKKLLFINKANALMKLNAQALIVEREKSISKQEHKMVAHVITGFANIAADARLVIDSEDTIENLPYPDFMDTEVYYQRLAA